MNYIGSLCFNYLRSEGYLPKYTDQEDVIFKVQGRTFIVSIDKDDDQYLRLLLPAFHEIEGNLEMNKALRVANLVNQTVKVGKIMIINNNAWAFAEQFIDSTPDIEDFFKRTIKVVTKAAEDFQNGMEY